MFSPKVKLGRREVPVVRASLMKPFLLLRTSLTSSLSQLSASSAPPGTRTGSCPPGWERRWSRPDLEAEQAPDQDQSSRKKGMKNI